MRTSEWASGGVKAFITLEPYFSTFLSCELSVGVEQRVKRRATQKEH